MRLSSLLFFILLIIVSVAIALVGAVYLNKQNHELEIERLNISNQIKSAVVNLSTLGAEYTVSYRTRTVVQWQGQKEKLRQLQQKLARSKSYEADALELENYISRVETSFSRLQNSISPETSRADDAQTQAIKLFSGQLLYELQQISTFANRLVSESIEQANRSVRERVNVLLSVAGLIILTLISVIFFLYKSVVQPGQKLKQAIEAISNGQLNYRMHPEGAQELREIGYEFNRMLDTVQSATEAQKIVHMGHWEWDIKSDQISWSDGVFILFGFQAQSFTPTYDAFLEMIHPEDRKSVESAVNNALLKDVQYYVEHRIVLKDGSVKYVKEQGQVIRDNDDTPVKMIGTVLDITKDHLARQALEASENLYKQMFEMNSAVKLLTDPDNGRIISANSSACDYYGYSRHEFLKLSIYDINTLDKEQIIQEMARAREDNCKFFRFSHRLASGEIRDVEVHTGPIEIEGRSLLHSIIIDVTERNRYEKELRQATKALQESEARNELAQILYGIGIWQWNSVTNEVYWSDEMVKMWGLSESGFSGSFEEVQQAIHPDDWQAWQDDVANAVAKQVNHELEFRVVYPDGSIRWIYALGKPVIEKGEVQGMFGICTDVTEKREQMVQLTRAASVFENAQEGIIITDADGYIIETNKAFTDITGFDEEEVIGKTPAVLKSGRHTDEFYRSMWQELIVNGHWEGEIWNRGKQGEFFAESLSISSIKDKDGDLINYVGVFSDITFRKMREEALEKKVNYDALTNLPNRRILTHELEKICEQPLASGLAILFIDLDGFKAINDTYGHSVGDELLVAVSKRIQAQLRSDDLCARVGGDEFVILVGRLNSLDEAKALAGRVLSACSTAFAFECGAVTVTCSIGVTFAPSGSLITKDSQLINLADEAMYEAKALGKNRIIYSEYNTEI